MPWHVDQNRLAMQFVGRKTLGLGRIFESSSESLCANTQMPAMSYRRVKWEGSVIHYSRHAVSYGFFVAYAAPT